MIIKRKLINFGMTTSLLASLLLAILVLASTASAGNYAKKHSDTVNTVVLSKDS